MGHGLKQHNIQTSYSHIVSILPCSVGQVWRGARQVARWAWSKAPALRGEQKPEKVLGVHLVQLPASPLDGGLAPRSMQ